MNKLITRDSRCVTPGSIYFCFSGSHVDGHDYINEAIKRGASAIYGTQPISGIEIYHQVDNINLTYIQMCQRIYRFDEIKDQLKIIGITGTDGKTSTAYLTNQILNLDAKSAYLGTSGFILGDEEIEYLGLTTPFAEDLYRYLLMAYQAGCKYFVMEVSSHSLVQQRMGSYKDFKFSGVVLTNLTPEHLDFHHDMENYLAAKLSILDYTTANSTIIVNADDEYFKPICKRDDVISFSLHDMSADNYVKVYSSDLTGINFSLDGVDIKSRLIGDFNIYNLVSSLLVSAGLGVNVFSYLDVIKKMIVPGRMELYQLPNDALAIIDFAHTPDSIKKVLSLVKSKTHGALSVVNGCAGERDTIKRPIIGEIMDTYCDHIYLTTDDPRDEEVSAINAQIKQGIKHLDKVQEIEDRSLAIKTALTNAKANDVILLLGKGGQSVQYMKEGPVSWIEQDVLTNLIGVIYG